MSTHPSTLVDIVASHARERGGRTAVRFLPDGEAETATVTWSALDRQARALAVRLAGLGRPGDRVLVLTEHGVDFVRAFLACGYAGMIAVPVAPPMPISSRRRLDTLRAITVDCGARIVLGPDGPLPGRIRSAVAELDAAHWHRAADVDEADADRFRPVPARPDDVCFLQYTSGSTASPKGVMVTHRSLLTNQRYLSGRMGSGPDDVVVCWLPLFHDAGLIVNVLQAAFVGAEAVLMPPLAFVQRPDRWLRAITKYRGTLVGAPNFAYDLCLRRIPAQRRDQFDLSSLRIAFNAAEPVRAATVAAFTAGFAGAGLPARAVWPCYGLAEITVFGVGPDPSEGPVTLSVDREALGNGRLRPGGDQVIVSSGKQHPPRRLEIVDPQTHEVLPAGRVGEIWMAGDDVAAGYWNRPRESELTFRARTAGGDGPFLRTGDLGVLHDDRLYVTGRLKDLVILGGRNHYPQDIELTVQQAHPWVRPDCVAAFGWETDDEERLVIVAEALRSGEDRSGADDEDPAEPVRRAVRTRVTAEHGVPVHDVVLVVPGSVPKTSSGKVQRQACRAAYSTDQLRIADLSETLHSREPV